MLVSGRGLQPLALKDRLRESTGGFPIAGGELALVGALRLLQTPLEIGADPAELSVGEPRDLTEEVLRDARPIRPGSRVRTAAASGSVMLPQSVNE